MLMLLRENRSSFVLLLGVVSLGGASLASPLRAQNQTSPWLSQDYAQLDPEGRPPALHYRRTPYATKERLEGSYEVSWGIGSGMGSFRDVQVPSVGFSQLRADGRIMLSENSEHLGLPIEANLGIHRRWGQGHRLGLEAQILHMASFVSPHESADASFGRQDLHALWSYRLGQNIFDTGIEWDLFTRQGLRHNIYSNVSSAHYSLAFMTWGGMRIQTPQNLSLRFEGGWAPWQDFGYRNLNINSSLEGSIPQTIALRSALSLAIDDTASVEFSLDYESSQVVLTDRSTYRSLGLDVPSFDRRQAFYELSALIGTFQLIKRL